MVVHHKTRGSTTDPLAPNGDQSEALPGLLRQSLRHVLLDDCYDRSDETDLRIALRDVCGRARSDGVRAEHLLVVLKELWRELPERGRLQRVEADDALSRVVSACINEFYQDGKIQSWDSTARCIQDADRIQAAAPRAEAQ